MNDQIGSPTHSDLVAETTIRMLDGLDADGAARRERCGLYHVSCGGETSWWGFAQRIIERAGLRRARDRRADSDFRVSDAGQAAGVLGAGER
ncbi:MAG: NAD(P)-dependent oxidoreductase [Chromatiales bacterium]|nr:NAD(P)-dependent oxidoreductase [Chromatiales bacterium]